MVSGLPERQIAHAEPAAMQRNIDGSLSEETFVILGHHIALFRDLISLYRVSKDGLCVTWKQ